MTVIAKLQFLNYVQSFVVATPFILRFFVVVVVDFVVVVDLVVVVFVVVSVVVVDLLDVTDHTLFSCRQ